MVGYQFHVSIQQTGWNVAIVSDIQWWWNSLHGRFLDVVIVLGAPLRRFPHEILVPLKEMETQSAVPSHKEEKSLPGAPWFFLKAPFQTLDNLVRHHRRLSSAEWSQVITEYLSKMNICLIKQLPFGNVWHPWNKDLFRVMLNLQILFSPTS